MAQNGLGSQQKPIPEMLLSLYLFCIFEVLIQYASCDSAKAILSWRVKAGSD